MLTSKCLLANARQSILGSKSTSTNAHYVPTANGARRNACVALRTPRAVERLGAVPGAARPGRGDHVNRDGLRLVLRVAVGVVHSARRHPLRHRPRRRRRAAERDGRQAHAATRLSRHAATRLSRHAAT
eukprot:240600-Pleurochrysis_carterae.AAC.1